MIMEMEDESTGPGVYSMWWGVRRIRRFSSVHGLDVNRWDMEVPSTTEMQKRRIRRISPRSRC